jgi:tRNA pseudouridine55 synthase
VRGLVVAKHGLLVLDKPTGVSTSFLVRKLARRMSPGEKKPKAGHAGTLDPFASGIVLTLMGDATRLQSLAMGMEKTYVARVLLGVQTDTLDPEGRVVAEADPGPCRPEAVDEAVESLTGELEQLPPAYSALKVSGQRAYTLARQGKDPGLKPRRVHVKGLELLSMRWPELELRVRCSAGTYIRSLARDLGAALGAPAHLLALRRTAVGPFTVERALAPRGPSELPSCEELSAALLPPLSVVEAAGLKVVHASEDDARAFAAGRVIRGSSASLSGAERVAVTWSTPDGAVDLLGLGEVREHDAIAPAVVLAAARAAVEA